MSLTFIAVSVHLFSSDAILIVFEKRAKIEVLNLILFQNNQEYLLMNENYGLKNSTTA